MRVGRRHLHEEIVRMLPVVIGNAVVTLRPIAAAADSRWPPSVHGSTLIIRRAAEFAAEELMLRHQHRPVSAEDLPAAAPAALVIVSAECDPMRHHAPSVEHETFRVHRRGIGLPRGARALAIHRQIERILREGVDGDRYSDRDKKSPRNHIFSFPNSCIIRANKRARAPRQSARRRLKRDAGGSDQERTKLETS